MNKKSIKSIEENARRWREGIVELDDRIVGKPIKGKDVLVNINSREFKHAVKALALEAVHEAMVNNMSLRNLMKKI
jgi:hypothetical protein